MAKNIQNRFIRNITILLRMLTVRIIKELRPYVNPDFDPCGRKTIVSPPNFLFHRPGLGNFGRSVIYFRKMNIFLGAYSLISRLVCARNAARYADGKKSARRVPWPVLAVGNLTLGGSGKTPLVLELIDRFLSRGYHPALITRGYRGSWEQEGGVLSDGQRLFGGWREAGDEPMMVARRFPEAGVFIGRHRLPSCLTAKSLGFDIGILDDAFQHLAVARDLDIVIHDPRSRIPLRENESALARADILLIEHGVDPMIIAAYRRKFSRLDIYEYSITPQTLALHGQESFVPLNQLQGRRILAFAGIARPERFFKLLGPLGVTVAGQLAFPDHYAYSSAGIARISAAIRRLRPDALITTEKDAVKIEDSGRLFGDFPLYILRIGFDLPPAFFDRVEAVASRARTQNA